MNRKNLKIIHRGEIYWLDYQFVHDIELSDSAKTRPVLIISSDRENTNCNYPTVLIAPISTLKPETKRYITDIWITSSESGLPEDSRILLGQIQTHLKDNLRSYIIKLPDEVMDRVDVILASNIGII